MATRTVECFCKVADFVIDFWCKEGNSCAHSEPPSALGANIATKFGHADVLSRLMQRDSVINVEYVIASVSALEAEIHHVVADTVRALPLTSEMISIATPDDVILKEVRTYMRTSWPETLTEDIRTYYDRLEVLSEIGGCIILTDRVIFPLKFHNIVLRQLHTGHPGIVRMKALARRYVYWPKIKPCKIKMT